MNDLQTIQALQKELRDFQRKYDNKPFTMEGTIVFINPKLDKSKVVGKNFFVRELCLEKTDLVNGQEYKSVIGFQISGNACDLVESMGLSVGDTINVYFSVRGTKKDSDKQILDPATGTVYHLNPKSETCFTNLNIYKIEGIYIANPTQAAPATTAPATPSTAAPAKSIPQPSGEIPDGENGKPMIWNGTTGIWEEDTLPF